MLFTVKRLGFFLTASLVFMAVMMVGFTIFYRYVEHISWLDSFYFTVITTRTIGFGDISPKTTLGKVGTIFNALLPATVFLGTSLIVIEAGFKGLQVYWKNLLMRRHLRHTIVIADPDLLNDIAVEYLADEQDFVIVHPTLIADLPDRVAANLNDAIYLSGDPTDDEVLRRANIELASRILIATSDDTTNLFVLVTAKGLNPTIVATVRVNEERNADKFRNIGADHLLPTYQVLSRMLSQAATHPVAHGFLLHLHTHAEDPFIQEVIPEAAAIGRAIRDVYPRAIAVHRDGSYLYDLTGESLRQHDVVLCIWLKFDHAPYAPGPASAPH